MAHDVFISYSSKNKAVADIICNGLENRHIRCWYAPRDITPGDMYGEAISNAIKGTRVFVVVYSNESRTSKPVLQEIELATRAECVIIPFKTTLDTFEGAFDYYLSNIHWIDAVTPPMDKRVSELADVVEHILQSKLTTESETGQNTAEADQKTEPAHAGQRQTAERNPGSQPSVTPPARQGSADSNEAAARAVERANPFFHTAKDSLNRAAQKLETSMNHTTPVREHDWRGIEQAPGHMGQPTADASAGQAGGARAQTKKSECSIRHDYTVPESCSPEQLKTALQNALHSFQCRKETVDQYQDSLQISAEIRQNKTRYKVTLEARRVNPDTVRVTLTTVALMSIRRKVGRGLILYGALMLLAVLILTLEGQRDAWMYCFTAAIPIGIGIAVLVKSAVITADTFCAELNAKIAEAFRSLR